ncbi:MAG: hypothetical protein MPJ50_03360 [Pirellulales bacterium]|nr:hypothetical protein [Pirellulales bacterium]
MSATDQATSTSPVEQGSLDETSSAFEQRWSHLISVTNWEKGKIIHQWRQALVDAGANATEYSDDAWSRRVGGVSGQHTGRLRRVHERFHALRETFPGLYWSHFNAATDWNDAEMWLEGAVQNKWSVQAMRKQRLEATGGRPEEMAAEEPAAEYDEDASTGESTSPTAAAEFLNEIIGPNLDEGPDFGDEPPSHTDAERNTSAAEMEIAAQMGDVSTPAPFEDMPELPMDMAEAFENLKLSILRHKSKDWRDVPLDAVLYIVNGLKQLAISPM